MRSSFILFALLFSSSMVLASTSNFSNECVASMNESYAGLQSNVIDSICNSRKPVASKACFDLIAQESTGALSGSDIANLCTGPQPYEAADCLLATARDHQELSIVDIVEQCR